jgi:hypothetical protein
MFSEIIHMVTLRIVISEVHNLIPTITKALTYLYPKYNVSCHTTRKEEKNVCDVIK